MYRFLTDNWLLQDVGILLERGFNDGQASEIQLNLDTATHDYNNVPEAGVSLHELICFLVNIVLRDSIVVDAAYTDTWSNISSLEALKNSGIITPYEFTRDNDQLISGHRSALVEKLCVTKSIKEAHSRNERSWRDTRTSDDPFLSQLLWGGAGMLSRSHIYEIPYWPHPLRQIFFYQASVFKHQFTNDAVTNTMATIDSERAKLFEHLEEGAHERHGRFVIPPIAMEIIEGASSPEQMIPEAITLRKKYGKLRSWLRIYQTALNDQDPRALIKYRKDLESVSSTIASQTGMPGCNGVDLNLSVAWFNINLPFEKIRSLVRFPSIRTRLTKLVMSEGGEDTLKRLLKLFGEQHSKVGAEAFLYINRKYSDTD